MFSMMSIAAQLQAFNVESIDEHSERVKSENLRMKESFREKAVQCLVLAKYTSGGPHILETLITILTGEHILKKDGATDGWLFIGMILHIAIRMGLHRDADHFPQISLFEGEMRRRIWTTILQLDLVLSLEKGLPRNATDTQIDTRRPLNLRDCDFDEGTAEMPAPRPDTEWTPILPMIAKGRLIPALGLVCDLNTDVKTPSYSEVLRVDRVLEDVFRRTTPAALRWKMMLHRITDSPNLILQKVSMETSYHKSRILLYRRILVKFPSQIQERDNEAVRICVVSALKILAFQQMLHEESRPFGRLAQLRWKVYQIFNQDVLLATSVLCLYFQDLHNFPPPKEVDRETPVSTIEEIREQLALSRDIWLQMSATSLEARKVAKALSIVLGSTHSRSSLDSEDSPHDLLMHSQGRNDFDFAQTDERK